MSTSVGVGGGEVYRLDERHSVCTAPVRREEESSQSVSVRSCWPDWRLAAAADDDERLPSLLPGDEGLDSGPGPALPTAGQKQEMTN